MKEGGQKASPLLVFITDIDSIGLETAQGLLLSEALLGSQRRDPRLYQAFHGAREGRRPLRKPASILRSATI
jgi:branched-chain amino acid transport system substrate-binding protein